MAKKRWQDLTRNEKAAVLALGGVQFALATTAWIDLARRPAESIRGPKPAWALAIAVNFVGPVAYFTLGRKSHGGRRHAPAASGSLPSS